MASLPIVSEPTLQAVQQLLLGQRTAPLTDVEVAQFFQVKVDHVFILVLIQALTRKVLNANLALLQAIDKALTKSYLITIAICLRLGADPNMYATVRDVGNIHVLAYTFLTLKPQTAQDNIIFNSIIVLLLLAGANPVYPAFSTSTGAADTELTTKQWITNNGYPKLLQSLDINNPDLLTATVGEEHMTQYSIILNKPTVPHRAYIALDYTLAITAFASRTYSLIPVPTTVRMLDNTALVEAVDAFNADAFIYLIGQGNIPSYLLTNHILTKMEFARQRNHATVITELERMLLASINAGVQLDQDQVRLLKPFGDLVKTVETSYQVPYWRKLCNNKDPHMVESLRKLAISLNVDHTLDKSGVCNGIEALARADRNVLKAAAHKRQQARLNANAGLITDFVGEPVNLLCHNRVQIKEDPLSYNDMDLAYYRDAQSNVWCYTSDEFASLLETGVNPTNYTKLPASFLAQLQYRVAVLKELGVELRTRVPRTFDQALDSLDAKDMVTEADSKAALDQFFQYGMQQGVTSMTLEALNKDQLTAALQTIGFKVDFSLLSKGHALITTAQIVTHVPQEQRQMFFTAVRGSTYANQSY